MPYPHTNLAGHILCIITHLHSRVDNYKVPQIRDQAVQTPILCRKMEIFVDYQYYAVG